VLGQEAVRSFDGSADNLMDLRTSNNVSGDTVEEAYGLDENLETLLDTDLQIQSDLLADAREKIARFTREPVTHYITMTEVPREGLEYVVIDQGDTIAFSWEGRKYHNLVHVPRLQEWNDCSFAMTSSAIVNKATKVLVNYTWTPQSVGDYYISSSVAGDCSPESGYIMKLHVFDWRMHRVRQAQAEEMAAKQALMNTPGGCYIRAQDACGFKELDEGTDTEETWARLCTGECAEEYEACDIAQDMYPRHPMNICKERQSMIVATALKSLHVANSTCDVMYDDICLDFERDQEEEQTEDHVLGICNEQCKSYLNTPECRPLAEKFFTQDFAMPYVTSAQEYCDQDECLRAGCFVGTDEPTGLYLIHEDTFCAPQCQTVYTQPDKCTLFKSKIGKRTDYCCGSRVRKNHMFSTCIGDASGMGKLESFHPAFMPMAQQEGRLKDSYKVEWVFADNPEKVGYKIFDSDATYSEEVQDTDDDRWDTGAVSQTPATADDDTDTDKGSSDGSGAVVTSVSTLVMVGLAALMM